MHALGPSLVPWWATYRRGQELDNDLNKQSKRVAVLAGQRDIGNQWATVTVATHHRVAIFLCSFRSSGIDLDRFRDEQPDDQQGP